MAGILAFGCIDCFFGFGAVQSVRGSTWRMQSGNQSIPNLVTAVEAGDVAQRSTLEEEQVRSAVPMA